MIPRRIPPLLATDKFKTIDSLSMDIDWTDFGIKCETWATENNLQNYKKVFEMINNDIFYKDRCHGSHIYHSKLDSSDFCLAGHSVTGKLNKISPN